MWTDIEEIQKNLQKLANLRKENFPGEEFKKFCEKEKHRFSLIESLNGLRINTFHYDRLINEFKRYTSEMSKKVNNDFELLEELSAIGKTLYNNKNRITEILELQFIRKNSLKEISDEFWVKTKFNKELSKSKYKNSRRVKELKKIIVSSNNVLKILSNENKNLKRQFAINSHILNQK